MNRTIKGSAAAVSGLAVALGSAAAFLPGPGSEARSAEPAAAGLEAFCTPAAVQGALAGLSTTVTVKAIRNGPFKTATRFVAAKDTVPAFCQVAGSFVTNPQTGKTANFVATLPAAWNGKYMQLGCSGHCGQFYVSDPATPSITVTAQGYAGQIIEKGYATFATDEGHEDTMNSASWALKSDGRVDQDFVEDFFYRAGKVLSVMGKEFTKAFYGRVNGGPQTISRSYFNGCSGGGRDAMVAGSYFPEAFDGIIAGSPYDILGMTLQGTAVGAAVSRSPGAALTPELLELFDTSVKRQCDALDGVQDGLIQNPAACNFQPERDLPRCTGNTAGKQCFTDAQVETASVLTSAVTDELGNVVQPGYSVSELNAAAGFISVLTDPTLKIFVHRNDPAFNPRSIVSFRRGGPGQVTGFHAVVPAAEVAKAKSALRLGAGHLPENMATLMNRNTKLLMWHNFSDEKLTPMSSINWYRRLARHHGGYAKVQQKARLFLLPGTSHCSIAGIAPNSFDAIGALEDWVERGKAPDALRLSVADRQFTPGAPKAPALQHPNWTATLCKFPEMARYRGTGDVKDASNWTCSPQDRRMLQVGESGRRAGVLQ